MCNIKTGISVMIASSLLSIGSSVYAEETQNFIPLYAGVGYSSASEAKANPRTGIEDTLKSSGASVFIGARVSDYFGVELGYADLGTLTKEYVDNGSRPWITPGTYVYNNKVSTTTFSAIGYLPIRKGASILAEIGGSRTTSEYSSDGSSAHLTPLELWSYGIRNQTVTEMKGTYGLGLQYEVDSFNVRFMWKSYAKLELESSTLSVAYSF